MKTILITGIARLAHRSIAKTIRDNHPDYKFIGCDIEKAFGFFMEGLNTLFVPDVHLRFTFPG